MGRSYYCEYCDKRMKCSVSIRKNHNDGLPHKIAKAEYMAQYKDPREILNEECRKTPCSRFLNGRECKFGMFCHFSHYTKSQLKEIEKLAERLNRPVTEIPKDDFEEKPQNLFPWNYPYDKVRNLQLPPSLEPYNIEMCLNLKKNENIEWG